MPTPPTFPTLPSFADLPDRWRPAHGRAVLAAVEASGLSPTEFAHATGVDVRRIFRWRARLHLRPVQRPARRQPVAAAPIRLVELVAHPSPAVLPVAHAHLVEPALPAVEAAEPVAVAAIPEPPVVPVPAASLAEIQVPICPVIDVTTPSGWQLRVPSVLLADLVHALSARSC